MLIRRRKEYAPTIDAEQIKTLPLIFFDGKITVIDTLGPEFEKAVRYLRHRSVIGFDTETRPVFTPHAPQNGVALLQLSSGRRAFLFRVYKIGLEDSLAAILANPKIIKVGAAVHDDIRGLQKIYPFQPGGFVDLQRICGEWGIQDKSVKKLTAILMGRRISKTQQLSNWEAARLSDAQKVYAATDAWICREMYFLLKHSRKCNRPEAEQAGEK
ncbi:MAG: 3'-5' exonuclease domain-containing protein 2 [Bacteroidales bacterium]|nr:3'-5' exonuclease domain-containing protein 2 [Bacteroidales bacterium]